MKKSPSELSSALSCRLCYMLLKDVCTLEGCDPSFEEASRQLLIDFKASKRLISHLVDTGVLDRFEGEYVFSSVRDCYKSWIRYLEKRCDIGEDVISDD